MATDAFGRLRTSEPFTTFNYYPTPLSSTTQDVDVWVRDSSGGGVADYNNSSNSIELGITNTSGAKYVSRTTKSPMEYQPGKSRLVMMSTAMITPVPSVSAPVYSRIGLFNITDSSTNITDGIWFEVDCSGRTMKWCEKVNNNGTPTLYEFTDASWNIDTFKGTGASGKTLSFNDMSKNLLIVIDQEWLGVGRVRCGFNIDGVTYYAHAFTHSHLSNAYTASPRQRLGYQLFSTGTPSVSYTMKQMCSTCMSEGGFFPLGFRNSISTDASGITIAISQEAKAIMALKIDNTVVNRYKNGIIKIINSNIAFRSGNSNSTDNMKYTVQLHSTNGSIGSVSGTPSFTQNNNSITSRAINLGTTNILTIDNTDGYILTSGFINANTTIDFTSKDYETLLTRTNISHYDTLYVTAQSNTAAGTVYGALDFIESL